MSNIEQPNWEAREREGFRVRRARLGREAGCRRLGASLWELPPGQAAYPYHLHLTEEELILVLRGRPQLRTPAGWRALAQGEIVSFPAGEEGAHQVVNRTTETVRLLSLSTNGQPDVVIYPDSGKLSATERRPDGGGFGKTFRLADAVDYWDDEEPPREDSLPPR